MIYDTLGPDWMADLWANGGGGRPKTLIQLSQSCYFLEGGGAVKFYVHFFQNIAEFRQGALANLPLIEQRCDISAPICVYEYVSRLGNTEKAEVISSMRRMRVN